MLLGVSGILFIKFFLAIRDVDEAKNIEYCEIVLAAVLVGVVAFAWFVLAIRCPACGGRPVWFFVRKRSAGTWLFDLVTTDVCPLCGEGGGEKRERR
jgi:hypothetical protein